MAVSFTDNSIKVQAALDEAIRAYLYEAGETLQRRAANNTTIGHETAEKWQYRVEEKKQECIVGNPLESSLWDELGTGEWAVNKDGRKGYWVYVAGSARNPNPSQKQYTKEEARKTVAWMRSEGLDAHYTNGRKPARGFQKAFDMLKPALIRRAEELLKVKMQ